MNDFKSKIKNDGKIIGIMLSELYSPNLPVLFKASGFDYFILDCEHGCFDFSMVAALAAAAKGNGIPMIVRIPYISREYILKYLDVGVSGLLIPMVSKAEDLIQVVEYAKYAPIGKRGVSTTRAHTGYQSKDLKSYFKQANEQTVILAQIESAEGLENVKSISMVQGVDGLIVGPNDLTYDMGIPGQYDHVLFKEAVNQIHQYAMESGKYSGMITSNLEMLKECMNNGMQVLSWNSELGLILKGAAGGIKELR